MIAPKPRHRSRVWWLNLLYLAAAITGAPEVARILGADAVAAGGVILNLVLREFTGGPIRGSVADKDVR
jgi:hypothetical protein